MGEPLSGAGVDTPSHLYSISSFPRNWSTHFGKRDEVQGYLEDFAEANDIRRNVRFRHEVTRAEFEESKQSWRVSVQRPGEASETLEAPILISAVGLLNRPKIPHLPGIETFRGRLFHSAECRTSSTIPSRSAESEWASSVPEPVLCRSARPSRIVSDR